LAALPEHQPSDQYNRRRGEAEAYADPPRRALNFAPQQLNSILKGEHAALERLRMRNDLVQPVTRHKGATMRALKLLKFTRLRIVRIERKVIATNEDIDGYSEFAGDVDLELRIAPAWITGSALSRLCSVNQTCEVNDRVAGLQTRAEHLADSARVRRKVLLLDRYAAKREKRLLDPLSAGA
jgi:hypothetical protein